MVIENDVNNVVKLIQRYITNKLLGYSAKELKEHVEKKFANGMSEEIGGNGILTILNRFQVLINQKKCL